MLIEKYQMKKTFRDSSGFCILWNLTRGMAILYAGVWLVLVISDDWKKVQLYKQNSYHTLRYFGIRNYKKLA